MNKNFRPFGCYGNLGSKSLMALSRKERNSFTVFILFCKQNSMFFCIHAKCFRSSSDPVKFKSKICQKVFNL